MGPARTHRRQPSAAAGWVVPVVAVVVGLGGCSGAPAPSASSSASPSVSGAAASLPSALASAKVFTGTPEEYTAALVACYRAAGYTVTMPTDPTDGSAFSTDITGHTDQEFADMANACDEQVGTIDLRGYSDEQIRASYDYRVAEFECLVSNGWASGSPPSWESYRDDWRASQGGAHWDPISDALQAGVGVAARVVNQTCFVQHTGTW